MIKSLQVFNLGNKRIIVRCDFNVPLDQTGNILDDFRIKETIPTIEYLLQEDAKIILISHLDSPSGQIREDLRLSVVGNRLVELLGQEVKKLPDCIGKEVENAVGTMEQRDILLLENLRFHKEEEENDLGFAKSLAKLGDIYVNDAFGVCNRAHSSIAGVPKFLPSCAGMLLQKEVEHLDKLLQGIEKPFVLIVGGKKVATKTRLLNKFSEAAEWILIAHLMEAEIKQTGLKMSHPERAVFPIDGIDEGGKTLDIGPKTTGLFRGKILLAKTILWNGPVGMIERAEFMGGTKAIAQAIIDSKAYSVAGGGETAAFLNEQGLADKFSHVSTGGGAMLAYLSGEKLPGLEALRSPD